MTRESTDAEAQRQKFRDAMAQRAKGNIPVWRRWGSGPFPHDTHYAERRWVNGR